MRKKRFRNTQDGVTLLLAIMVLTAVLSISLSLASILLTEVRSSGDLVRTEGSYYGAQAGIEQGLFKIKRSVPAGSCDSSLPGCYSTQVGNTTVQNVQNSETDPVFQDVVLPGMEDPGTSGHIFPTKAKHYSFYNYSNPTGGSGYTKAVLTYLNTGNTAVQLLYYLCQFDPTYGVDSSTMPKPANTYRTTPCSDPNPSEDNYWMGSGASRRTLAAGGSVSIGSNFSFDSSKQQEIILVNPSSSASIFVQLEVYGVGGQLKGIPYYGQTAVDINSQNQGVGRKIRVLVSNGGSGSSAVCPAGSVILSTNPIITGGISTASAPANFSGGSFSSSATSVATVTGTTINGVSAGASGISGTGWNYTNGASNCSLSATTLTVNTAPAPTILLAPATITFSGTSFGSTPAGQTLNIKNTGTAVLNWTAVTPFSGKAGTWCHIGTASGSLAANASQNVTITVDAPSNVGSFTDCGIRISDSNASNNPQDLGITYNVTAGSCPAGSVNLSTNPITAGGTSTASAPSGFSGGSFSSSATSVATVSGSTVTGVSAGTSGISGTGWNYTNGATNCTLSATTLTVNALTYNGFAHRRSITVQGSQVSQVNNLPLSDFPVLVCFNGSAPCNTSVSGLNQTGGGAHVTNANGYDIVFTSDSGCTSNLTWEKENYNPSSGELEAWVKIPSLAYNTNSTFYMCYGKASISTFQSTASAVWSNGYKGVWHLPNGTSLTANDSTINGRNGSLQGATPPSATVAKLGGGALLDGVSGYISVAQGGLFNLSAQQFTVSLWVRDDTTAAALRSGGSGLHHRIISWYDGTSNIQLGLGNNNDNRSYFLFNNSMRIATTGSAANGLHNVAGTFDGSATYKIYVDGSSQGGAADQFIGGVTAFNGNSTTLYIGQKGDNSRYTSGPIDEVRISSVARNNDWVNTEYRNQNSPSAFCSVGAEQ